MPIRCTTSHSLTSVSLHVPRAECPNSRSRKHIQAVNCNSFDYLCLLKEAVNETKVAVFNSRDYSISIYATDTLP